MGRESFLRMKREHSTFSVAGFGIVPTVVESSIRGLYRPISKGESFLTIQRPSVGRRVSPSRLLGLAPKKITWGTKLSMNAAQGET